MAKGKKSVLLLLCVLVLMACGNNSNQEETISDAQKTAESMQNISPMLSMEPDMANDAAEEFLGDVLSDGQIMIEPNGTTLESRFLVPEGYERTPAEKGSLTNFLRGYELKADGKPVLLYNGNPKGNQSVHAAVFTLPIEDVDLQQCADSVMRVYAEYYWQSGQYDKIAFHFTNGFLCEYSKWREGYRVAVNGNNVSWEKTAEYDESYDCFVKYMRMVFTYAGTLSMDSLESETIQLSELQVGDVILKGGSPGHVVMVVDVCVNGEGQKAFLLAQGYMPAQEFHIINNPLHENDPWYYAEEMSFPLETAEYTFAEESMIRRLNY